MAYSEHRHALVIEDELLIALEIEHQLEELGFASVDLADTPASALAKATAHRPDLITADMRIKGGTGPEAVDAITSAIGPVPVVYITANSDLLASPEDKVVIDKPMGPSDLARAYRRVCRGESPGAAH